MYEYVHGGDIYSDPSLKRDKMMLDYSANINPLGIPAGVRSAIKAAVADSVNYPDPFCRELRARLSRHFSLPPEMVYCGNGAADVLFRIMTALQPKRTLVLAPTFADYEKAALTAGSKIDYFTLNEDNEFAVTPEILKAITNHNCHLSTVNCHQEVSLYVFPLTFIDQQMLSTFGVTPLKLRQSWDGIPPRHHLRSLSVS